MVCSVAGRFQFGFHDGQHGHQVRPLRVGDDQEVQRRTVLLSLAVSAGRPARLIQKCRCLGYICRTLLLSCEWEVGRVCSGRRRAAVDRGGKLSAVDGQVDGLANFHVGELRLRRVHEGHVLIANGERLDRRVRVCLQTRQHLRRQPEGKIEFAGLERQRQGLGIAETFKLNRRSLVRSWEAGIRLEVDLGIGVEVCHLVGAGEQSLTVGFQAVCDQRPLGEQGLDERDRLFGGDLQCRVVDRREGELAAGG